MGIGFHWVSFNTQEVAEEVLGEIMWCWVTRLTQSCVSIRRLQNFYRSVAQSWLLGGRSFIGVINYDISHLNLMKGAEGRALCDSPYWLFPSANVIATTRILLNVLGPCKPLLLRGG